MDVPFLRMEFQIEYWLKYIWVSRFPIGARAYMLSRQL